MAHNHTNNHSLHNLNSHFTLPTHLQQQDKPKQTLFFPDQNSNWKPDYLELPIKVEGEIDPSRFVSNQSHNSPEQNFQHIGRQENGEEEEQISMKDEEDEEIDEDLDELMNEKQKGSIFDAYFANQIELNMLYNEEYQNSMKEVTAKCEEQVENYTFLNSNIKESGNLKEKYEKGQVHNVVISKKKDILFLMNSFRSWSQTLEVVMNFHKLSKKDSLSKTYTNVFTLLNKETRKLWHLFEKESFKVTSSALDVENERQGRIKEKVDYGMTKELWITSPGEGLAAVKLQQKEKTDNK